MAGHKRRRSPSRSSSSGGESRGPQDGRISGRGQAAQATTPPLDVERKSEHSHAPTGPQVVSIDTMQATPNERRVE
ncbi:hypothetical protein MTO96_007236 [Rhipicephalus appendiculatus]